MVVTGHYLDNKDKIPKYDTAIFKKKASGKGLSMTGNAHLRVKYSLSLVNLQSAAFVEEKA